MQLITIKQVLDKNGDFSHLELWQGDNHLELSLAFSQLDVQPSNYKWDVLSAQVKKIRAKLDEITGNKP